MLIGYYGTEAEWRFECDAQEATRPTMAGPSIVEVELRVSRTYPPGVQKESNCNHGADLPLRVFHQGSATGYSPWVSSVIAQCNQAGMISMAISFPCVVGGVGNYIATTEYPHRLVFVIEFQPLQPYLSNTLL
jgi:hypothetical protein